MLAVAEAPLLHSLEAHCAQQLPLEVHLPMSDPCEHAQASMSAAAGPTMNWDAARQSVKSVQLQGTIPEEVKRAVKRLLKEGDAPSVLAGLSVRALSQRQRACAGMRSRVHMLHLRSL